MTDQREVLEALTYRPDVRTLATDIEQVVIDSGVSWDEVHPLEVAARLAAAGYGRRPDDEQIISDGELAAPLISALAGDDQQNLNTTGPRSSSEASAYIAEERERWRGTLDALPAGDDRRGELARALHDHRFGPGHGSPYPEDYDTADAALAWFAARPSVPTVTTEQRSRAARAMYDENRSPSLNEEQADSLYAGRTRDAYLALIDAGLTALGIEVTP